MPEAAHPLPRQEERSTLFLMLGFLRACSSTRGLRGKSASFTPRIEVWEQTVWRLLVPPESLGELDAGVGLHHRGRAARQQREPEH